MQVFTTMIIHVPSVIMYGMIRIRTESRDNGETGVEGIIVILQRCASGNVWDENAWETVAANHDTIVKVDICSAVFHQDITVLVLR